jgi:hypothetical protein
MKIDFNNRSEVEAFIAELRNQQGITLIIVDPLSDRPHGCISLMAAADNIIDMRGGGATFLKRRDG